jgi:hypothetical protein
MTDQDPLSEQLPEAPYAIVEAFIDGERVNAHALKEALADPMAREHLVELLVLRDAVGTMAPAVWSAARGPRSWSGRGWLAAAAVLVMSVTAGYVAGQRRIAPPAPRAAVETTVDFGSAPIAPAPTRVIALRPGINWVDTSGGR